LVKVLTRAGQRDFGGLPRPRRHRLRRRAAATATTSESTVAMSGFMSILLGGKWGAAFKCRGTSRHLKRHDTPIAVARFGARIRMLAQ
jgi:hypothetical protein